MQEFPIEGMGDLVFVSPYGRFAVGDSTVAPFGTFAERKLLLWERGRGLRTIVTRRCYGMGPVSVANDGSVLARFHPLSPSFTSTIRFRLPDVVEESDGPPPDPPIPIVAPPGYSDPEAVRFSDNGRFAAGRVSDGERNRRPCIWDVAGSPTLLPSLKASGALREGAYFVSDDGARALYAGSLSDRPGGYQMLWLKERVSVQRTDLLRRANEPEWEDALWTFRAHSPNGRFFTVDRTEGVVYLVHVP